MVWTGEPPIMPFKLPSAAEVLARSIWRLIETAKREAERKSPVEAARRERQLFEAGAALPAATARRVVHHHA